MLNEGVMDTQAYDALYSKTFDRIVKIQEAVPKQGLQFVNEITTNLESFKIGEMSAVLELPFRSQDTEKIRLLSPVQGRNKTLTVYQYRSGIMVTKTAVESQKTRMIEQLMTGLPASADRKIEYAIAKLFNNYATETTADGAAIGSDTHYYDDPQMGTWDNLGVAAAFTTAAYNLAWIALQNRKNEKGFPDPRDLDQIVYPVQLHEDVMQVLQSPKVAELATNAINAFAGEAKAVKYNWLTSATVWAAHGTRMAGGDPDDGFVLVWRVRPEYAALTDGMNPELIMGKRLRMAYAVGAVHARNWEFNAGS